MSARFVIRLGSVDYANFRKTVFMTGAAALLAAFLVSAALLLVLRPVAANLGLIDKPGGRKNHRGDVPVVGGIAIFAGVVIAAVGGEGVGHNGAMLLSVSAFMVFLGAVDDRFNLPPRARLFAHVVAAIALVYGTGYSVPSLGDLAGFGALHLGYFGVPFTIIATVALINAFNMLDGLDGLAGSVGAVAFGAVGLIALQQGVPSVLLISASMLGAILAFLLFNLPLHFNRSMRTFMGDAGSTLLGFVLAGMALAVVQPTGPAIAPVTILWLMPIPIFELFTSTARRLISGLPPTQADNGHFHHKLADAGFSVRAICVLYLFLSLISAVVGVRFSAGSHSEPLLFGGFVLMWLLWLVFIANAPKVAVLLPQWQRRVQDSLR